MSSNVDFAFRYYTLQKKHLTEGNQNENEPPRFLGLVLNDFIIGSKNYGTGHNGGWKGANDNLPNTNNILITTDDTYKEPGATLINPTTGDPLDPNTIDRSTLSKFIIKAPSYKEYRPRTTNKNTLNDVIKQLNMTSTPSSIADITSLSKNGMYMTGPNADGVTDEIKFKIPGVYKIDYLYIDRATNPTADPYIIGTRWITVKSSSSGTPMG